MINTFANDLAEIRRRNPLVHNITNYVVMNFTANALLAIGASPIMAHSVEEVEEIVGLSSALVINIGTLSPPWVTAMALAAAAAEKKRIPIVLDPVGAGATRYRTETAGKLALEHRISVIRGNASEILALAGGTSATKGVDSVNTVEDARTAAMEMAGRLSCVVAVTGAVDFVTDGKRSVAIANGSPMMRRITGTGCAASAITGAFCAVQPDPLAAAAGALVAFGIAGEIAAEGNPGVGTYAAMLLNRLGDLEPEMVTKRARIIESGFRKL
ncbi:MAG: hydroxyethylthiazole kinase [Candidatus Brocadiia bacterium]